MKQFYNLRSILVVLLILGCTVAFAKGKNDGQLKNRRSVQSVLSASNPHAPAKLTNNSATYTFTASSGTFSSINTTGTVATGAYGDDASQINIQIGFSFPYYGTLYDKVAVSTNGFLSFSPTPNASDNPTNGDLANPQPTLHSITPFLAPLFGDLQAFHNVYYESTGSVGNHTFTIEWDGVAGSYYGRNGDHDSTISFQVILHEATGVIQFVYLPGNDTLDCAGYGPSVGLRDADTSFIYVTNLALSATIDSGTVHSGAATTVSSVTPPAGLTFTFTPQGALVDLVTSPLIGSAPRDYALYQNYPNPFNPTTTIEFTLPADGRVSLKIYDVLGREVATLLDENRRAGVYQQAVFDGSRFASGVYFSRLVFNGKSLLKKLLLLK